jgi:GMP synthase (glutamine-hydrolysing)
MGDSRTYDYAIVLRAVQTDDFMTAKPVMIPADVMTTIVDRIVNEVKGVNRVMYDFTSKPPSTIELE